MKLIDKNALVAEIEKRRIDWSYGSSIEAKYKREECDDILSFIDTLEVKDTSMPALDNGNMPVERWKEACEAASCQVNYRNSKGLTETCDDYFVDGVQWADEHPMKVKEVDLDYIKDELDEVVKIHKPNGDFGWGTLYNVATHFFELGIKARTDKELVEEVYSHIDSIKDTADRMTSGNFMHSRAAIKFSANTIAKVLELIGLKTQKGE